MVIEDRQFGEERALYGLRNAQVKNCSFEGKMDGESALKECRDIAVENCAFRLRYPLWHCEKFTFRDSRMDAGARAPVWYSRNGIFEKSTFDCVKLFRECHDITVRDCSILSPEAGWHCSGMNFGRCGIESVYFLLGSRDLTLEDCTLTGNYAFQYTENLTAEGCELSTKDMLWHAKHVRMKNCILRGEYLAWYSEDVVLENCEIYGTQPFCYCKGLRLVNCILHGCDRAFEYSEVDAELKGHVDSVKNPRAGRIAADSIGEIIREAPVYPCDCEIVLKKGGKLS